MQKRPKAFITKRELLENEKNRNDVGFGSGDTHSRLINTDGSFNLRRINIDFWSWLDVFHRLTVMSWPRFFAIIFASYFIVNICFSMIYILVGVEHLQGIKGPAPLDQFWGAFFFSAQTLTTVGYGHIAPMGVLTSTIAAIEALAGLLGFALATGLVYGRFSKPKPRILFSKNMLISPYLDMTGLMFRIINQSKNELVDVSVEITMSRLETLPNNKKSRKYYGIELERKQINFFPMNWTLVHPIIENSPLFSETPESMAESATEFLIYIKATEENFLQPVHARFSYTYNEIFWGAKFVPMFDSTQSFGTIVIDVQRLHDFEIAEL